MKIFLLSSLILLSMSLAVAQFTYPLQIGNRWQFKEPPPDNSDVTEYRVLGDTLMPNGRTYRAISDGLSASGLNTYYRQEGEKVYEYLTTGDTLYRNKEIVRFDFSKNIYDTVSVFQVSPVDTVVIMVIDTGSISIFGKVRPYKTFWWSQRRDAFYRMNRIVDSLGTTFYQIEPGLQLYLAGAVLDGVTYGTLLSVRGNPKALAQDFVLLQNYPNPFNPTTTITFRCPHVGLGRLVVYDMNGRQVKTLISGQFAAGDHSFIWDGTNETGKAAATGAYIYRLEIGSTRLSRIMLLLH